MVLIAAESASPARCARWSAPSTSSTFDLHADGAAARVVATKCDGCVDRLRRGDAPACVEACKVEALVYGELNELIRAGRMRQSVAGDHRSAGRSDRPRQGSRTPSPAGGAGASRPLRWQRESPMSIQRPADLRRAQHQRRQPRHAGEGARGGHRDGVGPSRRPGAAVRLLLARPELSQLRDGSVPRRSLRRRAAEGRVRRRRRHHRGPQPGPHHRRRRVGPLGPRPRHPRGVRRDRRGPDHRLRASATGSCARLAGEYWASPPTAAPTPTSPAMSPPPDGRLRHRARTSSASPAGCRRSGASCGRSSASRRAASTARTSRCCTARTWASTTTTSTSCSTPCAPACPTAGAARWSRPSCPT